MESNYKVAYNLEWSKLKELEPLDLSNRLDIHYNNENKQLTVPFFNEEYILDFTSETIHKKVDNWSKHRVLCGIDSVHRKRHGNSRLYEPA